MTDVLVLRRGVHGRPIEGYAAALRERLPDREVRLARTPAEERDLIADARVVTGLDISEELLDRAAEMELFAGLYAGVDHLPLDAFEERAIPVTSAAGVHASNVAEYAIGAILADAQGLVEGWRREQRREWRHYRTGELADSTVTVVGLGAIGTGVVERLAGFGVETVGVRHSPEKGGPTDEVLGYDDDIHAAYARSDYLVLTCPLTGETRGLLDREAFETLPPDSFVVNVARGPVIETEALVEALRGQLVGGAALDVTDPEPLPEDHPLWTLSNVRITPHVAGDTPAYYERVADLLAANLRRIDGEADGGIENRAV